MEILLSFLFVFNFCLAGFSFFPCMKVVQMGLQSTRFMTDPVSTIIVLLFFTFPFLCIASPVVMIILNHFEYKNEAIAVGFYPLIKAFLVFIFIVIFTK